MALRPHRGLYVAYQLIWAILFLRQGLMVCAAGALYMSACVLYIRL